MARDLYGDLKIGAVVLYFNETVLNQKIGVVTSHQPEVINPAWGTEAWPVIWIEKDGTLKQDMMGRMMHDKVFKENTIYKVWGTLGEFLEEAKNWGDK